MSVLDLEPGDDPCDVLDALDAYRLARAEALRVREEVAHLGGLLGTVQIERMTWAEVAAAADRVDRDRQLARGPLLPEVQRVVAAMLAARERYASLTLKHSRLVVAVKRRAREGIPA